MTSTMPTSLIRSLLNSINQMSGCLVLQDCRSPRRPRPTAGRETRLALHRLTDARDGRADFLLRLADPRLRVPDGLVDLPFGLQLVIAGQVADGLLDLAFGLVDLSIALILVPHDRLQSLLAFRPSPDSMRQTASERLCTSGHPKFSTKATHRAERAYVPY